MGACTERVFNSWSRLKIPTVKNHKKMALMPVAQKPFSNTLAAGEGFEPSQTDPESVVLPLHNPATQLTVVIIA